jgi:hypothetical protein
MKRSFGREKGRFCTWCAAAMVLASGVLSVSAQVSVVHYPDGREIAGTVVGVNENDFRWRLEGSRDVQTTPYSEINWIEFPSLEGWDDAQLAFEDGQYEEAAKYFEKIASVRYSGNYHPAPGNFATLAQLRALDCFRRLVNMEQIVALARLFEPELLPPSEKNPGAVLEVWAAVGAEKWEEAKAIIDTIEGVEADSREAIELGFLRGMILSELGQPDLGLTELAKTYTINLGTEPGLAKAAIRKSTDILVSMELQHRMLEVKGLVHLYAGIYGGQKLWEGASEDLVALLKEEAQMEFYAGKAPEGQQLEVIKAESKPGEAGVLFKVDFDPKRRKGNLSDPKYCIVRKDDGTFEFRGKGHGHNYTLTSTQATTDGGMKYELDRRYVFSITAYAPKKSKLAKCVVSLGYEKKGEFEELAGWSNFATSGAKQGYENRRRIEVEATIEPGSPAIGKPVTIRISGNGGREIRFVSDGVVELKEG